MFISYGAVATLYGGQTVAQTYGGLAMAQPYGGQTVAVVQPYGVGTSTPTVALGQDAGAAWGGGADALRHADFRAGEPIGPACKLASFPSPCSPS